MSSLEDRMKRYELAYKNQITPRSYIIIRLDGKNFSKYTKNLVKPFDINLSDAMNETMATLVKEFNAHIGYTQSDEIAIVLHEGDNLEADPMFGNSLQKLCSLSASVATARFNYIRYEYGPAYFDARVFVVPNANEVMNHMIWRQKDCTRNSISMAGQANFSHKQLQGLNSGEVQDKLFKEANINWNDYPTKFKRGVCAYKETYEKEVDSLDVSTVTRSRVKIDLETPIFTKDKDFILSKIPN